METTTRTRSTEGQYWSGNAQGALDRIWEAPSKYATDDHNNYSSEWWRGYNDGYEGEEAS